MKIFVCLMALTFCAQVMGQVKENIRQKVLIATDNPSAAQAPQPKLKAEKKLLPKAR